MGKQGKLTPALEACKQGKGDQTATCTPGGAGAPGGAQHSPAYATTASLRASFSRWLNGPLFTSVRPLDSCQLSLTAAE